MARTQERESLSEPIRLERGVRLGRYELLRPIAAGGMGQVWAARFVGGHGFSKLVAIKTILPSLVADPDVVKMFLDEARVAALIHHPNVCQTLELGDDRAILYMVMEWVDGASFRELLRASDGGIIAVDFPIAARLVADVCAGLHAAHDLVGDDGKSMEVVHRDVSPQNVLISMDGAVKVTDFGLVKALGRFHVTRASRPKGKVGYMAPEQLVGTSIDRRADVFSAGCVLYEATTGKPPFPGDAEPQVIVRTLIGEYEPPSAAVPGFPPELEAIIVRALDQDPAKRFATADAMRTALEDYLTQHPVTSKTLGELVRERCSKLIAGRRESIRAAAQKVDDNAEASDPGGLDLQRDKAKAPPAKAPPADDARPAQGRKLLGPLALLVAVTAVGLLALRMGRNPSEPGVPARSAGPADSVSALLSASSKSGIVAPAQTSADILQPEVSSSSSVRPSLVPSLRSSAGSVSSGAGSASGSAGGSASASIPTGVNGGNGAPSAIPTLPNPYATD